MTKPWRPWTGGCCPHCGDGLEIQSCETRDGWGCDGDRLRCESCHCPGYLCVDDHDCVYENMHDEPGCDCEWCRSHPADGCKCGHCGEVSE